MQMLRILLMLSLLLPFSVRAEEEQETDLENPVVILASETEKTAEKLSQKSVDDGSVQDEILPTCNDERVLRKVESLLEIYYQNHPVNNLFEKRRQTLQLKQAKEYEEEATAGFTTKKNQKVADKILMTKINNHISDNDIRICKSKTQSIKFNPIYLMMYPNEEGKAQLFILNFADNSTEELSGIIE